MKKKIALLTILACAVVGMTACAGAEKPVESSVATEEQSEVTTFENPERDEGTKPQETLEEGEDISLEEGKVIQPVLGTLEINNLQDHTFHAGFEAKDIYLDENGMLVIKMHVYDYDLYDMVDISTLEIGDTIVFSGKPVQITSLESDTYGVRINGGYEKDGYNLMPSESGVYFETLASDAKVFQDLGEVILPVGQDFVFTDDSDLEHPGTEYLAGDLITDVSEWDTTFNPNATTITVDSKGDVIAMNKGYMP